MTALVVVDVSKTAEAGMGIRLDIFPGGATPSVFVADTPFWIGYGFALDTGAGGDENLAGEGTRFELDVDDHRVELEADVQRDGEVVARRIDQAAFDTGLPVGWHLFHGRWYDAGRLLLSNRVSIEFVER